MNSVYYLKPLEGNLSPLQGYIARGTSELFPIFLLNSRKPKEGHKANRFDIICFSLSDKATVGSTFYMTGDERTLKCFLGDFNAKTTK